MVSLNGISIVNMKKLTGMEHDLWMGELFLDGVRIGCWSNDTFGAPDHFMLLPEYSEKKLKEEIKKRYPEWDMLAADIFMARLMDLCNDERLFQHVKADLCHVLLSVSDGHHGISVGLSQDYSKLTNEEIIEKEKDLIEIARLRLVPESEEEKHKISIWRHPSDFYIGDTITLTAIRKQERDNQYEYIKIQSGIERRQTQYSCKGSSL